MQKNLKKLIALALAVVMVFSLSSFPVYAEETESTDNIALEETLNEDTAEAEEVNDKDATQIETAVEKDSSVSETELTEETENANASLSLAEVLSRQVALATNINIDGDFILTTEDTSCYTLVDNTITLLNGADVTLSGTASSYQIVISAGASVSITLSNFSITGRDWTSVIVLEEGASATIILAEDTANSITSGREGCAINVPEGTSLTIAGSGILNASVNNGASSAYSAVIGSRYGSSFGTIKILGGTINLSLNGNGQATLGTGSWGQESTENGTIVIQNATVNCDRIGTIDSSNSNVIIIGSTVSATINANTITISDNTLQIDGDFTLKTDFEIPEDYTLTVGGGQTLTVAEEVTLTVKGILTVQGTVDNNGTVSNTGTITIENSGEVFVNYGSTYNGSKPTTGELSYQILWDTDGDGTVDDAEYVLNGNTPSHDDGSKDSTVSTVYTFTGWDPNITEATKPALYTAQFSSSLRTYTVSLPENPEGYTISTQDNADAMEYESIFTFTVEVSKGYYKTENFAVKVNGQSLQADADGNYSITVKDNVEITVEGIGVDSAAPIGDITFTDISVKTSIGNASVERYYNKDVKVEITAEDADSGVNLIEFYRSTKSLSEEQIEKITDWTEYTGAITETAQDGVSFIYYVKVTDNVGNVEVFTSAIATFDLTAPTIGGLVDGKVYCSEVTFTVDDDYIDRVTVNDETVTEYTLKADGTTYTVKAYDKAGNESEIYTVTVNNGHAFTNYVSNNDATCTADGTKTADCDNGCGETRTITDDGSSLGHKAKEAVIENEVAATCEEDGSYDEVVYCAVCNEEISREKKTVAATGHDWGEPVWSRVEDNSSATAVFTCKNDASHTQKLTEKIADTTLPKTGDDSNIAFLIVLMLVAGVVLGGTILYGRKERKCGR